MRILFTGASSFTGYWFARTLALRGHHVVAPLRGAVDQSHDDGRAERIQRLRGLVELVGNCSFGSAAFLGVARQGHFDALCMHHAEVDGYRSPNFDIMRAVAANTYNLPDTLSVLADQGIRGVVLTGSVFENDEGAGPDPRMAFSPYGLSKGLTAKIVEHRCHELGIPFGKFVIPHPFGPLEQPRLGAYLARVWREGGVAEIKTPAYVRDNIHVDLLAAAYCRFVEQTPRGERRRTSNPSGYIETQGAFVQRLAREVAARTGRDCRVALLEQTEFPEPVMRVNTEPAALLETTWNESAAWDGYAEQFR